MLQLTACTLYTQHHLVVTISIYLANFSFTGFIPTAATAAFFHINSLEKRKEKSECQTGRLNDVFCSWQTRRARVSFKVLKKKKTQWRQSDNRRTKAKRKLAVSRTKGMKEKSAAVMWWWGRGGGEKAECHTRSVTDSGSTAVYCPSGHRWSEGRWCPPRCCRETRRAQICLLSASATRCGRFLQWQQKCGLIRLLFLSTALYFSFGFHHYRCRQKGRLQGDFSAGAVLNC